MLLDQPDCPAYIGAEPFRLGFGSNTHQILSARCYFVSVKYHLWITMFTPKFP